VVFLHELHLEVQRMSRRTPVKIGEAADRLGISTSTIKRHEEAGDIPKAPRDINGHRVFSPDQLVAIDTALRPQGPSAGGDFYGERHDFYGERHDRHDGDPA
jgi:hypothetical protein